MVSSGISTAIAQDVRGSELRSQAQREGFVSVTDYAQSLVRRSVISETEVYRALGAD
jgi:hypothetical protein